jgi:hypothetical protein
MIAMLAIWWRQTARWVFPFGISPLACSAQMVWTVWLVLANTRDEPMVRFRGWRFLDKRASEASF